MAKLSNEALSGCVAKWARIDAGICQMKACRITALPPTAFVPKPVVFCNLRRMDGMSEPIFSPEMTLFTLSGVVRPRRSIRMPLRLSYLFVRERLQKHISDVGRYLSGECRTGETISFIIIRYMM